MANKFWLDVITPSKKFFSGEVEEVIVTTPQGKEGYMAMHSWTCKLLKEGELWIRESGTSKEDWQIAHASGGFIDVKDTIIIYADSVYWSDDPGVADSGIEDVE